MRSAAVCATSLAEKKLTLHCDGANSWAGSSFHIKLLADWHLPEIQDHEGVWNRWFGTEMSFSASPQLWILTQVPTNRLWCLWVPLGPKAWTLSSLNHRPTLLLNAGSCKSNRSCPISSILSPQFHFSRRKGPKMRNLFIELLLKDVLNCIFQTHSGDLLGHVRCVFKVETTPFGYQLVQSSAA